MTINRSKEWWIARARSEADMPVGAGVPDAQPTEDVLVKHMVDRFLSWRLPEAFHPDGGISFKATFNEHTAHPMKAEPTGTNLFSGEQATAMVRHMLDGSDPTPAAAEARATKATGGAVNAALVELLHGLLERALNITRSISLPPPEAKATCRWPDCGCGTSPSAQDFCDEKKPVPEAKDGAAPSPGGVYIKRARNAGPSADGGKGGTE